MRWKMTDGHIPNDFCNQISFSVDTDLTAEQRTMFLSFSCSAASKALTLGVEPGECMVVTNIGGANAVTVKAITGDTGTSVAAGEVALVVGSGTANASKVLVLN